MRRAALRQLAGAGPDRLIYSLRWQAATLDAGNEEAGEWLVVRREDQQPNRLVSEMSRRGQHCIDVQIRNRPTGQPTAPNFAGDVCTIEGDDPQHWTAVLQHYFPSTGDNRLDGIAWLAGTVDSVEDLDLTAHTKLVATSILSLLQALRREHIDQLARGFDIVTRDAIATEDAATVSPALSQFWGLGRVLSAEYPGLRSRLIDVDDFQENEAGTVDFLLQDSLENQYARRQGQFMVPRLVATKAQSHEPFMADPEGCYLITGGLGMLGRQAAKWLAERSARDIVLVSRKPASESTNELITQLERLGCRIHVMQADISDRAQTMELFARIQQELPPLKGVIHASGVLDDGLMAEQNWSRFETVLAPKQSGALWLDELTADMELDFFILYSSAASVLGSPGQANYATANAFLDGLAQRRRAAGLPALSINWGPWNEGMAASPTVVRSLAFQGLTPLTADEAHQAMEQLIATGAIQATVLDADWRRMRQRLSAYALPVLDLVAPEIPKGSGTDSQLVASLRAVDENERTQLLTAHVQTELQQILSLAKPPELDVPLGELGLDSLMAVELSTRLQQQLEPEITVSPTIAFDYPSPMALTQHLLSLFRELPEVIEPVSVSHVTEGDEVAIIGLGCRFPGADNATEFWGNLLAGVDSVRELPADRWDVEDYYSPKPVPGKMVAREGGFLDRIGDFDAEFFGISPQEAGWIDPQHRLLLEVSWAALEDAGIVPKQAGDANVGVFMGIMSQDYAQLKVDDEAGTIAAFQGAGLSPSAGVGRLSYMFGFEGPSLAIDSASSSSLVAVCQAAKSLLENECNLALAGGVNAILTPTNSLLLSQAGMLAPDGRCKSFSAAADGFGRGEGCGVVVLKRRRDAERDGDRILAVIRGSAISHNGTSGGLTAPSGKSQERVIRRALENSRMTAAQIDYFEAHGTGTALGDTIEIGAVANVLGQGRAEEKPLLLGSVKANIGHLEAAAGISGLIKVVLSMQHGTIPRQLHFEEPSGQIPWDRLPVKMVTETTPWPNATRRTASVHALGMSGTNAHCVLASVDETQVVKPESPLPPRSHHLLTLSAKSPAGLARVAKLYGDWFEGSSDAQLANACYVAGVGRRHWNYRAAIVADSTATAARQLRLLEQEAGRLPTTEGQTTAQPPKVAWHYAGDDARVFAAGHTLYETQPLFRETVDQFNQQLCDQGLLQNEGKTLVDAMFCDRTLATDARWRGPALFVLQAALTRLWQSWGLEPDVVLGEGVGQYSAACAAGVMSWPNALQLVAERSRICHGVVQVEPTSIPSEDLEAFEQLADSFDYLPANLPLLCSLSGEFVPVHRLLGGSYWRKHLTEPSRLDACLSSLNKQACDILLEVGPTSSLGRLLNVHSGECDVSIVTLLNQGQNETESMLSALGKLYVAGCLPNFAEFDRPWPRKKLEFPTYPFDRQRYWITDVCQYQQES